MAAKNMFAYRGIDLVEELRLLLQAVGDELIAELALEDRIGRRAARHPHDPAVLKEWKDSLRIVEALAKQYADIKMQYRLAAEWKMRAESCTALGGGWSVPIQAAGLTAASEAGVS
ncbi:MAG: hypothetical protein P4L56_18215 [Candidatus Sulfopaludibacter sp.]|nr:hypothetical protein [Candidatus Sulfopaludibacter sp.]